jgi:uncharacterized protein
MRLIFFAILLIFSCNKSRTGHIQDPPVKPRSAPTIEDTSFPVIDAHIHTDFEEVTKLDLLSQMKNSGIVGGVAHSSDLYKNYYDLKNQNIVHCAGIGKKTRKKQVEKGIQQGKFHCIKIYLGYIHKYASHRHYKKFYKLAEKYHLPVVFHTGDTWSEKAKLKYAHPLTVDEVAVDFPKVNFVLAHMGNPWWKTAAEIAFKNPNVYVEGSAFLVGSFKELTDEEIHEYMVKPISWVYSYIEDPKKIIYGSDWSLVNMDDYLRAFKKAIPKEHWHDVFHNNALRLFKIPGLKPIEEIK